MTAPEGPPAGPRHHPMLTAISLEHQRDHDDGPAFPREGCNGCKLIEFAWQQWERAEAAGPRVTPPAPAGLAAEGEGPPESGRGNEQACSLKAGLANTDASRSPSANPARADSSLAAKIVTDWFMAHVHEAVAKQMDPDSLGQLVDTIAWTLTERRTPAPAGPPEDALREVEDAITMVIPLAECMSVNEAMVSAFNWENVATALRRALRELHALAPRVRTPGHAARVDPQGR